MSDQIPNLSTDSVHWNVKPENDLNMDQQSDVSGHSTKTSHTTYTATVSNSNYNLESECGSNFNANDKISSCLVMDTIHKIKHLLKVLKTNVPGSELYPQELEQHVENLHKRYENGSKFGEIEQGRRLDNTKSMMTANSAFDNFINSSIPQKKDVMYDDLNMSGEGIDIINLSTVSNDDFGSNYTATLDDNAISLINKMEKASNNVPEIFKWTANKLIETINVSNLITSKDDLTKLNEVIRYALGDLGQNVYLNWVPKSCIDNILGFENTLLKKLHKYDMYFDNMTCKFDETYERLSKSVVSVLNNRESVICSLVDRYNSTVEEFENKITTVEEKFLDSQKVKLESLNMSNVNFNMDQYQHYHDTVCNDSDQGFDELLEANLVLSDEMITNCTKVQLNSEKRSAGNDQTAKLLKKENEKISDQMDELSNLLNFIVFCKTGGESENIEKNENCPPKFDISHYLNSPVQDAFINFLNSLMTRSKSILLKNLQYNRMGGLKLLESRGEHDIFEKCCNFINDQAELIKSVKSVQNGVLIDIIESDLMKMFNHCHVQADQFNKKHLQLSRMLQVATNKFDDLQNEKNVHYNMKINAELQIAKMAHDKEKKNHEITSISLQDAQLSVQKIKEKVECQNLVYQEKISQLTLVIREKEVELNNIQECYSSYQKEAIFQLKQHQDLTVELEEDLEKRQAKIDHLDLKLEQNLIENEQLTHTITTLKQTHSDIDSEMETMQSHMESIQNEYTDTIESLKQELSNEKNEKMFTEKCLKEIYAKMSIGDEDYDKSQQKCQIFENTSEKCQSESSNGNVSTLNRNVKLTAYITKLVDEKHDLTAQLNNIKSIQAIKNLDDKGKYTNKHCINYALYLRAESFRKCMAYQKKYIISFMGGCRKSERKALKYANQVIGGKTLGTFDSAIQPAVSLQNGGNFARTNGSAVKSNSNGYCVDISSKYKSNHPFKSVAEARERNVSKFKSAVYAVIFLRRVKLYVSKWKDLKKRYNITCGGRCKFSTTSSHY